MVLFDAHPWIRFTTGLILGCWTGVLVGCAIMIALTGGRLRQLAAANLLLREKLRSREKAWQTVGTGTGPSPNSSSGVNRPPIAARRVAIGGR